MVIEDVEFDVTGGEETIAGHSCPDLCRFLNGVELNKQAHYECNFGGMGVGILTVKAFDRPNVTRFSDDERDYDDGFVLELVLQGVSILRAEFVRNKEGRYVFGWGVTEKDLDYWNGVIDYFVKMEGRYDNVDAKVVELGGLNAAEVYGVEKVSLISNGARDRVFSQISSLSRKQVDRLQELFAADSNREGDLNVKFDGDDWRVTVRVTVGTIFTVMATGYGTESTSAKTITFYYNKGKDSLDISEWSSFTGSDKYEFARRFLDEYEILSS